MKETNDETTQENAKGGAVTRKSILDGVKGELKKKRADRAKGMVRERQEKIEEHERAIKQLDEEIDEVLTKFEAGVL